MFSKYFAKQIYVFVEIWYKGSLAPGVFPPIPLIELHAKTKKSNLNKTQCFSSMGRDNQYPMVALSFPWLHNYTKLQDCKKVEITQL